MVPVKVTSLEILTRIEVTHESAPRLVGATGEGWKYSVKSYTEAEPKPLTFLVDVVIIPKFQGGVIDSNVHSTFGPESIAQIQFKRSRKQETSKKADMEYLQLVSHEMRSPLVVIEGLLRMFINKAPQELKGVNHTRLQEMNQSYLLKATGLVRNLLDMCQLILELSKPEPQSQQLKTTEFNLQKMLDETCKFFERFVDDQKKAVKIRYEWDEHIDTFIKSDPVRIRQILINLISNSVKYTTKGEIVVSAVAETFHKIKISVRDTGLGIKKEDLTKLFTEFGRVQRKEDEQLNQNGVGLGLMLSNQLARSIGASSKSTGIQVDSIYGQGSEFWFYLENKFNNQIESLIFKARPDKMKELKKNITQLGLGESKEQKDSQLKCDVNIFKTDSFPELLSKGLSKKMERMGRLKNFFILVVDDSELTLDVLKAILDNLGVNCDVAMNPIEAMETIRKRTQEAQSKSKTCGVCCRYDMIITDMEMPFKNGAEFAAELRQIEAYKDIPIICSSAGEIDPNKAVHFTASLSKPIESIEVEHLLEKYTAKREAHICEEYRPVNILNVLLGTKKPSIAKGPNTKLTFAQLLPKLDDGVTEEIENIKAGVSERSKSARRVNKDLEPARKRANSHDQQG